VQAGTAQAVAPEEEALRQQISTTLAERAATAETKAPALGTLECRFNVRTAVRLGDCGPGPASGGPPYFRVDVWAQRQGLLSFGEPKPELFGRVFVPLHKPMWQRRPITWPVVNTTGDDIAYLTLEFAFGHAPDVVRQLEADITTSTAVTLVWRPPKEDYIVPVLGYRVESCLLHRGAREQSNSQRDKLASGRDAALQWQSVAELEASPDPQAVAKSLRSDTRYLFRVVAWSEAGTGDPAELEVTTGPGAPGVCGPPRLAGCAGAVLTIAWDPPADTGGVPIVGYWLWVRPHSSTGISDGSPSWLEHGQITHVEGTSQRADIHCEELNSCVDRYLCSVAALNSAGEVGPPTPEANSLPFPNPCAVCGPSPQASDGGEGGVFIQLSYGAELPSSPGPPPPPPPRPNELHNTSYDLEDSLRYRAAAAAGPLSSDPRWPVHGDVTPTKHPRGWAREEAPLLLLRQP